ncbi:MAG: mandelate racemase/muconate lactonizing enzyme family protein [Actinomycetota bacterium]
MSIITSAEAFLIDVPVETVRTDSVQAFLKQETIFVRITTDDGNIGLGYSYTIGTGGTAVLALLRDYLVPKLMGMDSQYVEKVWNEIYYSTRATATGAITSLAVAAIDTAIWDLKCKRTNQSLVIAAGGYRDRVPLYDTEGGWLHLTTEELVFGASESKAKGWLGVKLKVGKADVHEDFERLAAVRAIVGPKMHIMVDANQSMTLAEAKRRAKAFEPLDLFWFEEPLPADDIAGHAALAKFTSIPIAVGETMYSVAQFQQYLHSEAAEIIQVDVARVGGITPWLKVAHLAESFNVKVCPHFLMEIHVSLAAAIPNGLYVEHIPQLRSITHSEIVIESGFALAPKTPGLGIDWNFEDIEKMRIV